ncbi:hypothetical protein M9Y10_030158 [Tritrichomonas musculus]|uniref:Inositol-1-monophosphatase n=1 Tax=Tritrichomonas musculus TaxID=1915356 RepID=A0ABR2KQ12_9EUKA
MEYEDILVKLKEIALGSGKILMKYFEKQEELIEKTKETEADIVTNADIESDKYIREEFAKHFPGFGIITEEGEKIQPKVINGQKYWLCADPLDGTTNFACNLPIFSVSIACLDNDYKPIVGVVYDPTREEIFWAIKGKGSYLETKKNGIKRLKARENTNLLKCLVVTGFNPSHVNNVDNNISEISKILPHVRCIRRLGSACLDFCNVAASRIDCYWEKGPHIWDVASGWLIATEAGALVTHYDGSPFTQDSLLKPMIDLIVATKSIHTQIKELINEARSNLNNK